MPAETRLAYTSKYVYDFLVQATAANPMTVEPNPGFEIQVRQWHADHSFRVLDLNAKFPALSFLVNRTWYCVHSLHAGSPNYRCVFRYAEHKGYDFIADWDVADTLCLDLQESVRDLVRDLVRHVPLPCACTALNHAR